MHLQMSRILNIILVQAKNDEERSAIMAKGNMTIRMEPELKAQAAALFKSLGMDLSTATGIFYRQALRCHGLPFEVKVDEPNAVTYAAMEAAENVFRFFRMKKDEKRMLVEGFIDGERDDSSKF